MPSRASVITSGKDTFCAGADLAMLEALSRGFADLVAARGRGGGERLRCSRRAARLSLLYRRIETCGKPWVAAINGTAVGGGFELTLACHQRIAADNARTRVGLPEIKIGLFPGAGGTQRIARMLPPSDALQFLLKGDQLAVSRAKAMKLIDAVVPAGDLIKAAKDWIKAGGAAKAPWDMDGFKLPGGPVYSKAGMMTFPPANAIYRRETYDNYPAARAIMQVVYEGLQLPMEQALRVESRWFAKILPLAGSSRDDPLAVRLDAGAQQGRAPSRQCSGKAAEEDRRHRRRIHGRRHRLCQCACRYRGLAHRSRSGDRRKGQGAFAEADDGSGQSRPRQCG